jgi:hypothetical protein
MRNHSTFHCAITQPTFHYGSFFQRMRRRLKSASAVSSEEFPPNYIQNLLPSPKKTVGIYFREEEQQRFLKISIFVVKFTAKCTATV